MNLEQQTERPSLNRQINVVDFQDFYCRTTLVDTFREQYPTEFKYGGNRAIIFEHNDVVPIDALRHCIAQALTYHRWK